MRADAEAARASGGGVLVYWEARQRCFLPVVQRWFCQLPLSTMSVRPPPAAAVSLFILFN